MLERCVMEGFDAEEPGAPAPSGDPEERDGRPGPSAWRLLFWAALAAAAALALWTGGAGAHHDELQVGWTSRGGAAVVLAAVDQGFFKEEGLTVAARVLTPEALAAGLKDGTVQAGEIGHRGLALAAAGSPIKYVAGLFSGFVEIVGRRDPENRAVVLAVADPGSGPAVAAARWYRGKGVDPDKDVTWLTAPDPEKALGDGEATVFARWELKRADRGHGHGHGAGPPAGQGRGSGEATGHGAAGDDAAATAGHGRSAGAPAATGHGPGEAAGQGHGSGEAAAAAGHGRSAGEPAAHGHGSGEAAGHGHPDGNRMVLFSASANLPKHDPGNPNPHAGHTSAHHLFESFVVLEEGLATGDPARAAAVARALIRGAAWVGENKEAAADLVLAAKASTDPKEAIVADLARWMWMPGVSHAKEHLAYYIHEGLRRGTLPADLDEGEFFKRVFSQVLPDLG